MILIDPGRVRVGVAASRTRTVPKPDIVRGSYFLPGKILPPPLPVVVEVINTRWRFATFLFCWGSPPRKPREPIVRMILRRLKWRKAGKMVIFL